MEKKDAEARIYSMRQELAKRNAIHLWTATNKLAGNITHVIEGFCVPKGRVFIVEHRTDDGSFDIYVPVSESNLTVQTWADLDRYLIGEAS